MPKEKKSEETTTPVIPKPPEDNKNRDAPTYVYVGPSLPGGLMKSNTILRGTLAEISDYYTEILQGYPAIKYEVLERLIVPVEKLAKTRQDIEDSGTLAYARYKDIENLILKARKEEGKGGAK